MSEITSRECCFRTANQPFEKAVWEVTFTCPLKCTYCFQDRTGHKNELSRVQLSQIRGKVVEFLKFMAPSKCTSFRWGATNFGR